MTGATPAAPVPAPGERSHGAAPPDRSAAAGSRTYLSAVRRRGVVAALVVAFAGACRPVPPPRAAAIVSSALAPAGDVVAVVVRGDALYVFARDRATIERGGAAAQTVRAPDDGWAEAVALPALDGEGTWVVARSAAGGLWHVTAIGELEPIGDRLGLTGQAQAIAASAPPAAGDGDPTAAGATVAIEADDALAILHDRRHVARFPFPGAGPGVLTAGRDRIALRKGADIEVWQLADQRRVDYQVPGALAALFIADAALERADRADRADRLIVATATAIYVEAGERLRRVPAPAEIRTIAAAGSRAWVATARGIYVFDGSSFAPTSATAAAGDRLFGLPDGDAVLAGRAGLVRLSIGPGPPDPQWLAAVQPIAARVCNRCHLPGGSAGVDLSTAAAWRADRGELIRRVVETRTMPPAGSALSDVDRQALAAWLVR